MTDLSHYLNVSVKDYYSNLFEEHLKENMELINYTTSEFNLCEPEKKLRLEFEEGKNQFSEISFYRIVEVEAPPYFRSRRNTSSLLHNGRV